MVEQYLNENYNEAMLYIRWLLLIISFPLFAAPHEGAAMQEMRFALEQFEQDLHSHKVEIDILHEKLQDINSSIASLKKSLETTNKKTGESVESRLSTLEKSHNVLSKELKSIEENLQTTQTELASLDKQLKSSLKSMIALLQPGGGDFTLYTVKEGDSLGQIALDHKTTIKKLKELNNLSSDRISVGQKLQLP